MAKLYALNIDTTTLTAAGGIRRLEILSDIGAEFTVQIFQSAASSSVLGKYYNFKTNTFTTAHTSENVLSKKMTTRNFSKSIFFPAVTGLSYSVILLPKENTELFDGNKVISRTIQSAANTTLTFAVATLNAANYSATPPASNLTSTGTPAVTFESGVEFDCDYTVGNATTDAGGFGFRLSTPENISQTHWYFTTTEVLQDNPAGDGEDSTTVTVADLTDITTGMQLLYHKGTTVPTNKAGSAVGTTVITGINTSPNANGNFTLTFSKEVAFEDGETMTFRLYGLKAISTLLDCRVDVSEIKKPSITALTAGRVTTSVRGAVSASTTVTCTTTQGIGGGSFLTFSGISVNNRTTNNVNVVTPDPDGSDGDGQFTCDVAQTFKGGEVLSFKDSSTSISINFPLSIQKYPSSNRTIYLDLDKFITPGIAGS